MHDARPALARQLLGRNEPFWHDPIPSGLHASVVLVFPVYVSDVPTLSSALPAIAPECLPRNARFPPVDFSGPVACVCGPVPGRAGADHEADENEGRPAPDHR